MGLSLIAAAWIRSGAVGFYLDDALPVLHFYKIREGS
jgi:hypothetical protein